MFFEIDVPKQLTKFWNVIVEKFIFTIFETWKTILQNILVWFWNRNEDTQQILLKKQNVKIKVRRECFQYVFVPLYIKILKYFAWATFYNQVN